MSQPTGSADGVPLLVRLRDARVVCVGAGRVAASKLPPLLDEGADVHVVAPEAVPAVADAAERGDLVWAARPYRPDDLEGAVLALAVTDDPRLNERVAADARARATLCVGAGGGSGGTAAFLGVVRRGALLLAVSTGGHSPALAARVRAELAATYGPEYGQLADLLGALRRDPHVRAAMTGLSPKQRRARWRAVLDTDILDLLRSGRSQRAREVASACLSSSSD